MQDRNVNQLGRMSRYAQCMGGGGGYMQGDSAVSNHRLCSEKNMRNEKCITSLCFFLPRSSRW